jgi:DNA polymerase-3 subunit epsilon
VFTIRAVPRTDSSRWARWLGLANRRARRAVGAPKGATRTRRSVGASRDAAPEAFGITLFDVCFAVVDVETTGGSPDNAALTEIGAAKFRGGECMGTFQTLVDPGCAVPPLITLLTGITDDMVDVSFDRGFLDAALTRTGREPLANISVDTLTLARRLLVGDVPNCRLRTLAAMLELEHRPSHRALDDVLATADLLHRLIERASGYGVYLLGDLVELASSRRLPSARVS